MFPRCAPFPVAPVGDLRGHGFLTVATVGMPMGLMIAPMAPRLCGPMGAMGVRIGGWMPVTEDLPRETMEETADRSATAAMGGHRVVLTGARAMPYAVRVTTPTGRMGFAIPAIIMTP